MLLDNPSRPDYYRFSTIYKFFDYKVYEENEIRNALKKLIENKLIEEDNGYFNITRTAYLKLRQQYKLNIILSDRSTIFIIPVLVGVIASIISGVSSFDKLFNFKRSGSKTDKTEIELRIGNIEKHISEIDKTYNNKLLSIDTLVL
jgi:hypothetical protein